MDKEKPSIISTVVSVKNKLENCKEKLEKYRIKVSKYEKLYQKLHTKYELKLKQETCKHQWEFWDYWKEEGEYCPLCEKHATC